MGSPRPERRRLRRNPSALAKPAPLRSVLFGSRSVNRSAIGPSKQSSPPLPLPPQRRSIDDGFAREIIDDSHPGPAAARAFKPIGQHGNRKRPAACADERLDIQFHLIGAFWHGLHARPATARTTGAKADALGPDVVQRGDLHAERNRNIIRLPSIDPDDSFPYLTALDRGVIDHDADCCVTSRHRVGRSRFHAAVDYLAFRSGGSECLGSLAGYQHCGMIWQVA